MTLSLYQRLSISLLIVFVVILIVFIFWSQSIEQRMRYQSEQSLHLSLAANLARDNPLLQQGVYDHKALKNLFHTLMVLGPAFEFYYLDDQGNILTHSADPSLVKRDKVNLEPLLQLTQNRAQLPIYGDDPRHLSRQKIFSAAPVFNGINLKGYLYVIVAGEKYDSAVASSRQIRQSEYSIAILVFAIVLLFIIMLCLFRYFTNPLRQLIRDMNLVQKEGFNQVELVPNNWQKNSYSEVHQLGFVFQNMIQTINQQFSQLKNIDENRKTLLADLSHDLRTPLSSIQGYIETIAISDKNLTEQQKQTFIGTALRCTKQLKKMIDQIFELAHLDKGDVSMTYEEFNLLELLYDVKAKFELAANEKSISIKVEAKVSGNQIIKNDIGKIERVLSNLIENALRHSSSGGEIILSIETKGTDSFMVKVKDFGTGISDEDIPYIFDARYRGSNATKGNNERGGLGLAICKKLLSLMNEEISVESVLGQGSCFSFNIKSR